MASTAPSMFPNAVTRITGRVGALLPVGAQDLETIGLRHADVGDHQIDGVGVGDGQGDGVRPVGHGGDLVPVAPQDLGHQLPRLGSSSTTRMLPAPLRSS